MNANAERPDMILVGRGIAYPRQSRRWRGRVFQFRRRNGLWGLAAGVPR